MSKIARWLLLNLGIGIFPVALKLLIRIFSERPVRDVLIDSSDIIFIGLAVSITTLADLASNTRKIERWEKLHKRFLVTLASSAVISAVWYGIQEMDLVEHPNNSTFRANTWYLASVFTLITFYISFNLEKKLFE
jgi:hypothetical protein